MLENNEGLLMRDFKTYEPFYRQFGLSCSKTIDTASDICYCLKRENNAFFNEHILQGDLDLSSTVLIVDEVDDLVVNEKPSLLYNARDETLSPAYRACYRALIRGESRPAKADPIVWNDAKRIKLEADAKLRGADYERGESGWAMLEQSPDGTMRLPKVPLTDDWLVYKNYADFEIEPHKDTFRSSLCTPYMYQKYCCIFGLTGSVGGEAERAYIAKTYRAVPFEVPQFLHTCDATTKEEARCLGVVIKERSSEKVSAVVKYARKFHTEVPVLVITRGAERDEMSTIVRALVDAHRRPDGSDAQP